MKVPCSLRSLGSFLFLFGLVPLALAQDYNLLGPAWPAGSDVVIKMGLGPASIPLQDGSVSWNASAADALDIWAGYADFITIKSISSPTVPQASGDAVNSVYFSGTIFGDDFGDGTLAVTVYRSGPADRSITEADVIVNNAYRYDSYRGPLQTSAADIHRILVHEFGHVLGLDHEFLNPPGQVIMEPEISDLDHPTAGDVAGISYLYGASFYAPPRDLETPLGYDYFDELLPNNNPTSFSAIDLPPGITLGNTGEITGKATVGGDYFAVVTAHGPLVDVSEGYHFKIFSLDEVPGLISILPLNASSIVADPVRPRVYAASGDGIDMIDVDTLVVTNLAPGFVPNAALSISADGATLLETEKFSSSLQEVRIDLESLDLLGPLAIPGNNSAVLEGLNEQAYVVGVGEIDQFNATTGELQNAFASTGATFFDGAKIALSMDRHTLYVAREGTEGELSRYDVSGSAPILLQQLSGSYSTVLPSGNGQFVYYSKQAGDQYSLLRAPVSTLAKGSLFASSQYFGPTAEAPDGSIFQSVYPVDNEAGKPSGSYAVYDPVSLHETSRISLVTLPYFYPYIPLDITFDSTGKYIFALVSGNTSGSEVWVLSSDFASLPPLLIPTKNLLNISTRARVESGENAMIGGFIVQGSVPKKVLVRGLGLSLPITGAMSNPTLELHDGTGKLIAANDNWKSNQLNILRTLLPPSNERESAILMTLNPGAYTAIVRDVSNQPGLSLVEVYDLDAKNSSVANISTRGKVGTGDNVMIGGFIVGGEEPTRVVVRALGPSLAALGITVPLADPVLEIHDSTGKLVSTNDNWRSTQPNAITATGLAPSNDKEAAILLTLDPGSYTAIVRGQAATTGVALVEVYNLDANSTVPR